jgi:hypothetical protein
MSNVYFGGFQKSPNNLGHSSSDAENDDFLFEEYDRSQIDEDAKIRLIVSSELKQLRIARFRREDDPLIWLREHAAKFPA